MSAATIAEIANRLAEEASTMAESERIDAGLDPYALADIFKALADMFQQASDETRKALDERFNR
jgi:hypothetical protein